MRRINSVAFVRGMRAKWGRGDAMARFRALLLEKVEVEDTHASVPQKQYKFVRACVHAPSLPIDLNHTSIH